MILKEDKNSKSKSYNLINSFFLFNKDLILRKIKTLSKGFKFQVRICLHENKKEKLHQMIIYQPQLLNKVIKKHPKKDKSYYLINGTQIIELYDKNKKVIKKIKLNKKNNFLFIKKNTFHSNYAITKNSVHMESISGPFDRKNDRVY